MHICYLHPATVFRIGHSLKEFFFGRLFNGVVRISFFYISSFLYQLMEVILLVLFSYRFEIFYLPLSSVKFEVLITLLSFADVYQA